MDFPHLDTISGASPKRQDFRALISQAISQAGTSPTAKIVLAASRTQMDAPVTAADMLDERIRYFAAGLYADGNHTADALAPHGAFFPKEPAVFRQAANYDQAVYQDGLGNGKPGSIETELSAEQASLPGHNI